MSASRAETRTAPASAALRAGRRATTSDAAAPCTCGRTSSARRRSKKAWYVSRSLGRRSRRQPPPGTDACGCTHQVCSAASSVAPACAAACRNGSRRSLPVKKSARPRMAARVSPCRRRRCERVRSARTGVQQQQAARGAHHVLRSAQDAEQRWCVVERRGCRVQLSRKLQRCGVRPLGSIVLRSRHGAGARHASPQAQGRQNVLGGRQESSFEHRLPRMTAHATGDTPAEALTGD